MKPFRTYREFNAQYLKEQQEKETITKELAARHLGLGRGSKVEKAATGIENIAGGIKSLAGAAVKHGLGGELTAKELVVDPTAQTVKGAAQTVTAPVLGTEEESQDKSKEQSLKKFEKQYGEVKMMDANAAPASGELGKIQKLIQRTFNPLPGKLYTTNHGVLILDIPEAGSNHAATHYFYFDPNNKSIVVFGESTFIKGEAKQANDGLVMPFGEGRGPVISKATSSIVRSLNNPKAYISKMKAAVRGSAIPTLVAEGFGEPVGSPAPHSMVSFLQYNYQPEGKEETTATPEKLEPTAKPAQKVNPVGTKLPPDIDMTDLAKPAPAKPVTPVVTKK